MERVLLTAMAAIFLFASGCAAPGAKPSAAGGSHSPGVALNQSNFAAEVSAHKGLVLVDFWAEWCGPCRMVAPVLTELSRELEGKVKFANVDVDKAGALAKQFEVRSIPLLVLFRDGKEVDRVVGAAGKAELQKWLETHLKG